MGEWHVEMKMQLAGLEENLARLEDETNSQLTAMEESIVTLEESSTELKKIVAELQEGFELLKERIQHARRGEMMFEKITLMD